MIRMTIIIREPTGILRGIMILFTIPILIPTTITHLTPVILVLVSATIIRISTITFIILGRITAGATSVLAILATDATMIITPTVVTIPAIMLRATTETSASVILHEGEFGEIILGLTGGGLLFLKPRHLPAAPKLLKKGVLPGSGP